MISHSPEDLARVLLSRLKIEPPTDLEIVAAAVGLHIQVEPLVNLDGVMSRIPKQAHGIVAVRAGIRGLGRVRFTLAHEIGHYIQQHGAEILCKSSNIETNIYSNHPEEVEANLFASEILMTTEYVSRLLAERSVSIETVKLVAERSKSSLTATVIQCMKVMTEPCAAVISVDGKVRFYESSKTWKYVVRVGCGLDKRSVAAGLDLELNKKTGCVPISAWTTIARSGPVSSLEEQSIYLPPYNMTLSLLKPVLT